MSRYYASHELFGAPKRMGEDVDPLSSMSGIADVMLVFACGLMIALVTAWSVDLGMFSRVEVGEEIENAQSATTNGSADQGNYVEMGTVYMDTETGQYYLVEEE